MDWYVERVFNDWFHWSFRFGNLYGSFYIRRYCFSLKFHKQKFRNDENPLYVYRWAWFGLHLERDRNTEALSSEGDI